MSVCNSLQDRKGRTWGIVTIVAPGMGISGFALGSSSKKIVSLVGCLMTTLGHLVIYGAANAATVRNLTHQGDSAPQFSE
jgi:hypothetical protein